MLCDMMLMEMLQIVSFPRRRNGSFFFLDKKETKNQGLHLILEKFVKPLLKII